jgi:lysophospholipase L1-like esterase
VKKILFLILYNIIAVLLILAAIELSVRIFSNDIVTQGTDKNLLQENTYGITPSLKANSEGYVFGKKVEVNENGFLKNSCVLRKKKRKKVLFFGDSVTMGVGVDSDSSFAARLQQYYADSLEIDNLSLIGYNVNDYSRIVQGLSQQNKLRPYDEVVFFFCINDNVLCQRANAKVEESCGSMIKDFFISHSYLYVWRAKSVGDASATYYHYDKKYYYDDAALDNLDLRLSQIKSNLQCKVQVIALPCEYQMRENYYEQNTPQDVLRIFTKKYHFSFHDCKSFAAQTKGDKKDLFLYADGIHFSNAGHRAFSSYLIDNKLLIQ